MIRDPLDRARLRTLQAALTLVGLMAFGGALAMLELPKVQPIELVMFVVATLSCALLLPITQRKAERGDRIALDRIGMVGIGIMCLLLLQRMIATLYGPMFEDPRVDFFRLHFACTALVYLGAVAVMRARSALRFSWIMWLLFVLITLPGLYKHVGFSVARPGVASVLIWLLVANPLFILLMHALPKYEEQIDRQAAEVAEMRGRTELMDKLAESERRFNLVVEGLEVGVWDRWIGPPEKRWWSPRFYELLGYRPDELEPSADHLRALLHPDDRERAWEEGVAQLRRTRTMNVDCRLRTRDRGYRWFNSRARADVDGAGRIVRLAGSMADIHDRRTAEDALHDAQAELTRLSYRDPLTDLHNRRYFEEHFQREWERARRNRQPLAVVLIDLDHFKSYNDQYGHPAGDAALVKIAQLLSRCANRATDIVARLGGEEFGIVLPEATATGGEDVARRVLAQLVALEIEHAGAPNKVMTLSAGIAAIEGPDGPGPAELFGQADQALYEAKRRGRNGTVRYSARGTAAA
ncbi:MAG TPA: sensor domain-containing diguanylate cyclase [Verrucomicrobiae bacterium]|nr:sensor domain-containing diguanylate cyclase [Verrucomicrobiae bacterium]